MVGEEVEEPPVRCEGCGSTNVTYGEFEYETGVYAPDGGAETWVYYGYHCDDCGALTEL